MKRDPTPTVNLCTHFWLVESNLTSFSGVLHLPTKFSLPDSTVLLFSTVNGYLFVYCIVHIYILTYRQFSNAIKKSDRPIRILKITFFDNSALSKPFEIAKNEDTNCVLQIVSSIN